MTLQQFLLILLARKKIVLLTLLGTVAVTVIVSLILPKNYTSVASVVVDVKSPDPIAGMVLPAMAMPGYMATQVDIINSDRVSQRVVKLLKLDQNPTIKQQWQDDTEGRGTIEVWLAALLQKKLDVKPSRESNVINIGYKSSDAGFSAAVANAFAQSYIDTNIELKVEPARQYAAWFDRQSKALRERVEQAQAKLSAFQQQKGIIATDERLNFENQKLNELQSQLVVTETQGADANSKQKSGGADTVQDVMQSPVVNQLKTDIARQEAKLQEMAGNLGRNHPQYQRMEAELASLKVQLAAETSKIGTSIGTSKSVSREKAGELKAAIETHKQRILDLKKSSDEVAVLQREVEAAQKAYEAVAQRFTQSSLESQSTQTNVAVLTPASESLEASSPKLLLNTLLSIFLGTLLGVGAALVLEMTDRRIRSIDDIEQGLGIAVLTVMVPPAHRAAASRRLFGRKPPALPAAA
jgi:succinoglycan biosynthesis transport protein ExoP